MGPGRTLANVCSVTRGHGAMRRAKTSMRKLTYTLFRERGCHLDGSELCEAFAEKRAAAIAESTGRGVSGVALACRGRPLW